MYSCGESGVVILSQTSPHSQYYVTNQSINHYNGLRWDEDGSDRAYKGPANHIAVGVEGGT